MKFKPLVAVFLTVAFTGLASAGSLTIPNTFVSGETARASEVNENFTAIEAAVDDNDARIDQFGVGFNLKQERVTGSCDAGQYIRLIKADGSVTCQIDSDTTYSAGSGLQELTAGEFSINPAIVQKSVDPAGCESGSSIRLIDIEGNVTCEADVDTDTTYTADANGFRGITLDGGNEFRLSDGYVSVPYSAFVASNAQDVVKAYFEASGFNGFYATVYGSSSTHHDAPHDRRIYVETANTQLQVCQLSHQISPTEAYTYFVNNGNANCDAIAPLTLPHNAVLDSLSCKVYDNSASNSLQVKLLRVPLTGSGSTQDEIFSSNVSATIGAPQVITGSLSDPAATLVANNSYAYHLQMIWENEPLGDQYRVYGCSVGYTF